MDHHHFLLLNTKIHAHEPHFLILILCKLPIFRFDCFFIPRFLNLLKFLIITTIVIIINGNGDDFFLFLYFHYFLNYYEIITIFIITITTIIINLITTIEFFALLINY
jgi:hypothetical protein